MDIIINNRKRLLKIQKLLEQKRKMIDFEEHVRF